MHTDLMGSIPVSKDSFEYLMMMVDRTTVWVEAMPLKGIAAGSCMQAFLSTWVPCFGVPQTLTSDRGTQFSSASWSSFCNKLGVCHMTMAY